MFPDYKTPAIAGAPVGAISGLKIDLTKLFGGDVKDALEQAVLERDRELVRDGREAVGIPKRQADKTQQLKDGLDNLMDALDLEARQFRIPSLLTFAGRGPVCTTARSPFSQTLPATER